jgi:CRISPR-associated protein Csm1
MNSEDDDVNATIDGQLIEYGRLLMAQVAGGEKPDMPDWTSKFLGLLGAPGPETASSEPLQSIFTLIDLHDQRAEPVYLRPVALSLDMARDEEHWVLAPTDRVKALAGDRKALYREFLSSPAAHEHNLERFFYLMRKYASTLPNTYGEAGVSLFEQWKVVAALVAASGDTQITPTRLGLLGGDIPGIQRTINLVTSKGAAKAMRGRSAFIQLLGTALVQRLLDELGLGPANVVYDAGGNFVLLTAWDDGLPDRVQNIANDINLGLLAGIGEGDDRFDGFHGDLAVALAAVEIPLAALQWQVPVESSQRAQSLWQKAEEQLKHAVAAAKQRPFGDLALAEEKIWRTLFDAEPSETDDFCAVCRRQRRADETFVLLDSDEVEEVTIRSTQQCRECVGFRDLAQALGHHGARLLLDIQQPVQIARWQHALFAVAKRWYSIGDRHSQGGMTLSLSLDDFPASGVDGFRLMARTTPMTEERTIKPNDLLASRSTGGMKRLGVLRMDVDNLGELIVHGLPQRTLTATAELSASLERFFAGWLDRICRRVDSGNGLFYVLFAGGDDLFVIGPWTLMVPLAQAIYSDFTRYAGRHPAVHLSAGIAVVGAKAPLYAAGESADTALHQAKRQDADNGQNEKNAISFLDRAYHWEPFAQVDALQKQLVELVKDRELPFSLLTTLRAIESRYRLDNAHKRSTVVEAPAAGRPGVVKVYFGPWMWRQAYALARIREAQSDAQIKEDLKQLETALLQGRIEDLGLAARWAQWVTRKEQS